MAEENQAVSNEDIAQKLDALGEQMNWLCENLSSLFEFVSQMGASGGGLRGVLSLLKSSPPELQVRQGVDNNAG